MPETVGAPVDMTWIAANEVLKEMGQVPASKMGSKPSSMQERDRQEPGRW